MITRQEHIDLATEILRAAREIGEEHGVHVTDDSVSTLVSAIMRCGFALAKAVDPHALRVEAREDVDGVRVYVTSGDVDMPMEVVGWEEGT